MAHANKQRGEALLVLKDGTEVKLLLTLGAIEEIESELGLDSLADMDENSMGSTSSLITLLVALSRASMPEVTRDQVKMWPIDMANVMGSVNTAFKAAGFGEEEPQAEVDPDVPPKK